MVRETSTSQSIKGFLLYDLQRTIKRPKMAANATEVRQRDNYKCQLCGSTTTFLHVHHLYYKPATKVWEYDIESLVTLCENCHNSVHSSLPK